MNKTLKLFYEFLEANGALITWEQNYIKRQTEFDKPKSRAEFFYSHTSCTYHWIMGAFLWSNTPQGHLYWQQLDHNWRIHLSQNN